MQSRKRGVRSFPWWIGPNLLALDTALAVGCWSVFVGRMVGSPLSGWEVYWVAAAVWLVYTADQWLDSIPGGPESKMAPRHVVSRTHRKPIAVLWLGVWVFSLVSAGILLEGRILMAALVPLAAGILYLIGAQKRRKEGVVRRDVRAMGRSAVVGFLVAGAVLFFPLFSSSVSVADLARASIFLMVLFTIQTGLVRAWEGGFSAAAWFWTGFGWSMLGLLWVPFPLFIASLSMILLLAALHYVPVRDGGGTREACADLVLALSAVAGLLVLHLK